MSEFEGKVVVITGAGGGLGNHAPHPFRDEFLVLRLRHQDGGYECPVHRPLGHLPGRSQVHLGAPRAESRVGGELLPDRAR